MKLQVFNKLSPCLEGRFIALFQMVEDDKSLDYADGYNDRNSISSLSTEEDLPKSLENHFRALGYSYPEYSTPSVHNSLLTVCDPDHFESENMVCCFIIELLDNDTDFRIIECIEDFTDWFNRYPYPAED